MLAARLPGILPPLEPEEALETSMIHSLAGLLDEGGISRARPFRTPHHTASMAAIVGGGRAAKPGEISLAHHGVLFLDELAEFSRHTLETLRQPLESGEMIVARAARIVRFPARFQLVAATNPCPCGHRLTPNRACRCTPAQIAGYDGRISGPLRDRLDLIAVVPPVDPEALHGSAAGEETAAVRMRVDAACQRQARRHPGVSNARLEGAALLHACQMDEGANKLLRRATARLDVSARARAGILRVARTIADLSGDRDVAADHLAEALQFRSPS
jgi:magnesium chelatase family protein